MKQVQTGQILQSAAIGPNGRVLLSKDTTLNEQHIEILNTWGVVEIDVLGDCDKSDVISLCFNDLSSEAKKLINKDLNDRFRLCDQEHPLFKELILELRNRLVQVYSTAEK